MTPLDTFGQLAVARFRDPAIDSYEGLAAGRWKAPGLAALQQALAGLTEEQRGIVRRCVIASLDRGLHDFLFALTEAHDRGAGLSVTVDGQDVADASDGLHGEPFGEVGWVARFGRHPAGEE